MSIVSLIASDNFITVNRDLVKMLGLEAAVLLGEFASESNYWVEQGKSDDGFFFSTIENIEERTSLSVYKQKQAINVLTEKNLIEVSLRGLPARRFIRLNEEELTKVLTNKFVKNSQTRMLEINKLQCEKLASKNNKEKDTKRKDKYEDILDEVDVIRTNPSLREAFIDFIEFRKSIKKPLTEKALKLNINDAFKHGNGDPMKIKAVVEQSIKRGWCGMFPLKEESNSTEKKEDFFEKTLKEINDASTNDSDGVEGSTDLFPLLL